MSAAPDHTSRRPSHPRAAHARGPLLCALAGSLLACVGCAVKNYSPPLLPLFMRDAVTGTPAPESADTGAKLGTPLPPQGPQEAPPLKGAAQATPAEAGTIQLAVATLGAAQAAPSSSGSQGIKTPAGKTPPEKSPSEKTPAGKEPIDKAPKDKEKTPGGKEPTEKAPTEKGAGNKAPAGGAPGAGGSAVKGTEEAPQPAKLPGIGLPLNEAIRQTLDADPKLKAAWETIALAKADLWTSSLLPNPSLFMDGQLLPLTRPFTPDVQGGPPQIDLQVAWPIDWFLFGKRAAAIASARLGVDVSAADFADQVRQRVAAAIAAFFDVLEAQAQREVSRQDLESLKRVEAITIQRVQLGGVGTVERDRIRLAVLDSAREFRRRETVLATSLAALRTFLGRQDIDPSFAVSGSLEVPAPAAPPEAQQALALAEKLRPDLISLRRQYAKTEADVRLEKTRRFPVFAPGYGLTRQFQQDTIGFPDATSYAVFLNTAIPLFDRNQGNIRKAESAQVQVMFNLQAQLAAARGDIEQAVAEYRAAYRNVVSEDPEQLKTASKVRASIQAAYRVGGRSLLEVLDAERAYRDTYRLYIGGQSAYWHALYRLNAAIGKQVLR